MRRIPRGLLWPVVLCTAALSVRCASSGTPPSSAGSKSESSSTCVRGTLGLEAGPISRQLRDRLGLPEGFGGAVVTEVIPGGPAATAGIRAGDIVQEIGAARIGNDCELIDSAFGRSCEPVRVVVRRGAELVETTLVPVDQESFFERTCRDGVATGCFRQAWLLWSHHSAKDRERALEIFASACRAGSAEACAAEGLHRMNMRNPGANTVAVLERSCELSSGAGCAHLAYLYATARGKLVKKDDRRATALYVKSCDLGDAKGCYNVGLNTDEGRGTVRDVRLAVARYAEACDLGSSTACTNLGFQYQNGLGVEKDEGRAFALFERGCRGTSCQPPNRTGCVNMGRAYRDGNGIAKDPTRAAAIFRDACDREADPDDVDAEENRAHACSLLAALYLTGNGVGKDAAKGRELSQLGCDRGDGFGCFNAAAVEPDAAKAAVFLDRGCEAGDGESCHDLAVAYQEGTGVSRDRRRAAELLRKACELGFEAACSTKEH